MSTWILEPRDTLLCRDARPSNLGAGAMRTIDFPWPSTLAGLLRSRIGSDEHGQFTLGVADANQISVRGPLLVELGTPDRQKLWLPAPHDCFYWADSETKVITRQALAPLRLASVFPGAQSDLPDWLELIGYERQPITGKPYERPAFWPWEDYLAWLMNPRAPSATWTQESFGSHGIKALPRERRQHVAIDPATQTARDGALFMTEMLRFVQTSAHGDGVKQLGLLFACANPQASASPARPLLPGCVMMGGERRLSFLREHDETFPDLPKFPEEFFVKKERTARVILLTPGIFKKGFAPPFIGSPEVKVIAAAVPRAQVVSGWDFQRDSQNKQKGAKPIRRMAPAGSVYWVRLPATMDQQATQAWLAKLWMQNLSDEPTSQEPTSQDVRDGFGLCVVGLA
ncbi:type III-B CRISPR module-associated Cmr3 family protein [Haliangium sp. UPWRP_2]|uniref:type III-B CRISPR module-associated Cmr3 family protein n=1 Tax=Haliangium sp. UPWRP_2 TaxID=1931276 RepID=UPI000B53A71E|nr:type III-B CRISPR module-associated Cmr3 family protein [Haliangium sp. UPWRP_2]PSM32300.1 hypothetical protein BVG81_000885 [Haliangium sp. UPWRP_2]